MLELLIEFVLEVVLQVIAEVLVDIGYRGAGSKSAEKPKSCLSLIGYAFWGVVIGGISLFIFPHRIARSEQFHGLSLILAPTIAGLVMAGIGNLMRRKEKKVTRLESFSVGFIFALGMAAVRFLYAK